MLFNSLQFPIFFSLFLIANFAIEHKYRWILILSASYYFYGSWHVGFAGLLALTTIVDFTAGILLEKAETMISANMLPYAMTSRGNSHNINGMAYLEACYKAGNMQLAQTVKAALKKDLEQQKKYYDYLRTDRPDLFAGFEGRGGEAERNEYFLQLFGELIKKYEPEAAKTPVEGNVNITNPPGPDSAKQKDSLKKPK